MGAGTLLALPRLQAPPLCPRRTSFPVLKSPQPPAQGTRVRKRCWMRRRLRASPRHKAPGSCWSKSSLWADIISPFYRTGLLSGGATRSRLTARSAGPAASWSAPSPRLARGAPFPSALRSTPRQPALAPPQEGCPGVCPGGGGPRAPSRAGTPRGELLSGPRRKDSRPRPLPRRAARGPACSPAPSHLRPRPRAPLSPFGRAGGAGEPRAGVRPGALGPAAERCHAGPAARLRRGAARQPG